MNTLAKTLPRPLDPSEDGITHLNVYSKAATELGRFLTNFAYAPAQTPDGKFDSIEGYWYWLGLPETLPGRERLRSASGWQAKSLGRELRNKQEPEETPDFQRRICEAVETKVRTYARMTRRFATSELPIVHYYTFGQRTPGGPPPKIIEPKEHRWLLQFLTELRQRLQTEEQA